MRDGSSTPGRPTVAWVTCDQLIPRSLARPCASPLIWATVRRCGAVRSSRRARTVPVMSASAARTQWLPTSMPTTQPDSGFRL